MSDPGKVRAESGRMTVQIADAQYEVSPSSAIQVHRRLMNHSNNCPLDGMRARSIFDVHGRVTKIGAHLRLALEKARAPICEVRSLPPQASAAVGRVENPRCQGMHLDFTVEPDRCLGRTQRVRAPPEK
jgi:hypothetical protein